MREERIPFDIRGDNLIADFDYDSARPLYRGHLSSRRLHFEGKDIRPVAFDFDTDLVLDKDQLQDRKGIRRRGAEPLDASGSLRDWKSPYLEASFDSNVLIADLASVISLPVERTGTVAVHGKAVISASDFSADGQMNARGLAIAIRTFA